MHIYKNMALKSYDNATNYPISKPYVRELIDYIYENAKN